MALQFFKSDVSDCLKRLAKGEFESSEDRDQLLEVVRSAEKLRAKDVAWMAFRPDRALREACLELLKAHRDGATIDQFVVEAKDKAEAPLRAGAEVLFGLRIQGVEAHLANLIGSEHEATRDAARRLVLNAPVTGGLAPLLWRMVETGSDAAERLPFLRQLAAAEISSQSLPRWKRVAADVDAEIRATALKVLADKAPEAAADQIVDQLACVDYSTQQHLIAALTRVARQRGVEFIDRLLPLMASGSKLILPMPP